MTVEIRPVAPVSLVTRADSGIGKAVAVKLAQQGIRYHMGHSDFMEQRPPSARSVVVAAGWIPSRMSWIASTCWSTARTPGRPQDFSISTTRRSDR